MAKLIYLTLASLDGYVADKDGTFGWAEPDEEVHAFVNDLARPVGTYLYGRGMYETLVFWERPPDLATQPPFVQDFAEIWQRADKIVYSRTLQAVTSARTLIEQSSTLRRSGSSRRKPALISAWAVPRSRPRRSRLGSSTSTSCSSCPSWWEADKRSLPGNDVRVNLELLDQRRFRNGTVYLHYRTRS